MPTPTPTAMSLNDPQWGRGSGSGGGDKNEEPRKPQRQGGQEGPPDLDELWRDFNRRLNSLFGRRGGGRGDGGGFGGMKPDSKGAGLGVLAILAAALVIWFGSGFYIVQEGQVGVVTTFGKFSRDDGTGIPLARPLADPGARGRRRAVAAHARGRWPRSRRAPQGSADADRRREHRRHPLQRPVPHQGRRERRARLPVQQPLADRSRAAGSRVGDARSRRAPGHGPGAVRNRARRSPTRSARACRRCSTVTAPAS